MSQSGPETKHPSLPGVPLGTRAPGESIHGFQFPLRRHVCYEQFHTKHNSAQKDVPPCFLFVAELQLALSNSTRHTRGSEMPAHNRIRGSQPVPLTNSQPHWREAGGGACNLFISYILWNTSLGFQHNYCCTFLLFPIYCVKKKNLHSSLNTFS